MEGRCDYAMQDMQKKQETDLDLGLVSNSGSIANLRKIFNDPRSGTIPSSNYNTYIIDYLIYKGFCQDSILRAIENEVLLRDFYNKPAHIFTVHCQDKCKKTEAESESGAGEEGEGEEKERLCGKIHLEDINIEDFFCSCKSLNRDEKCKNKIHVFREITCSAWVAYTRKPALFKKRCDDKNCILKHEMSDIKCMYNFQKSLSKTCPYGENCLYRHEIDTISMHKLNSMKMYGNGVYEFDYAMAIVKDFNFEAYPEFDNVIGKENLLSILSKREHSGKCININYEKGEYNYTIQDINNLSSSCKLTSKRCFFINASSCYVSDWELNAASIICTGEKFPSFSSTHDTIDLTRTAFHCILSSIHYILCSKYIKYIETGSIDKVGEHINILVKNYIIDWIESSALDDSILRHRVNYMLYFMNDWKFNKLKEILIDRAYNGHVNYFSGENNYLCRNTMMSFLRILKPHLFKKGQIYSKDKPNSARNLEISFSSSP